MSSWPATVPSLAPLTDAPSAACGAEHRARRGVLFIQPIRLFTLVAQSQQCLNTKPSHGQARLTSLLKRKRRACPVFRNGSCARSDRR